MCPLRHLSKEIVLSVFVCSCVQQGIGNEKFLWGAGLGGEEGDRFGGDVNWEKEKEE